MKKNKFIEDQKWWLMLVVCLLSISCNTQKIKSIMYTHEPTARCLNDDTKPFKISMDIDSDNFMSLNEITDTLIYLANDETNDYDTVICRNYFYLTPFKLYQIKDKIYLDKKILRNEAILIGKLLFSINAGDTVHQTVDFMHLSGQEIQAYMYTNLISRSVPVNIGEKKFDCYHFKITKHQLSSHGQIHVEYDLLLDKKQLVPIHYSYKYLDDNGVEFKGELLYINSEKDIVYGK